MRVLVFCPTHRLEPETVDSIFRLDPGEHQMHVMFTRHNPARNPHYNILYNFRQGRQAALDGNYDAMLTIESDMIVPADALVKLSAVDADVAIGLYVHRHQADWQKSDYNPTLPSPVTDAPWVNAHPDLWADAWGKVIDVTGTGLGICLIRRAVLEAVQFRLYTFGGRWVPTDCDTHFYEDVLNGGFCIRCDTTVICGHRRPDGMILWPGKTHTTLMPGIMTRPYHMERVHGTANA